MNAVTYSTQGHQSKSRSAFGGRAKRSLDIMVALTALVVLLPLMLLIALAVKAQDGGPVLFVQQRVGLGGAPFPMLKFRSMRIDASARLERLLQENPAAAKEWREKQKITNDPRVTALGRVLRRMSLDELPQLANVLAGDMSVVGPRPMLEQQIADYGEGFPLYCTARPGITGLWQVSGRNRLNFRQRAQLDGVYLARGWRVLADLVLLARTAGAVASTAGAC